MAAHSSGRLPLLIIVWYSFSLLSIVSAAVILEACKCAATLCALQLGAAALACRIISSSNYGHRPEPLESVAYSLTRAVAIGYSCGFALTNAAIEFATPAFVETVKSSEPLSTVALAACFLGERESTLTNVSLVPLVMGVAMASGLGEGHVSASFSAAGLVLSLASNVSFSARAIATKALLHSHPRSAVARSDLVLFYHVSRIGMLLLAPIAIVLDARTLASALSGMGPSAIDGGGQPLSPGLLWMALLANCASHAIYNAISFAVLSRVSVATHAVLNIVRRVVMIAGTAVLFHTRIDAYNWLGIFICVFGCLAFARGKQTEDSRVAKVRKRATYDAKHARLHAV